MESLKYWLENIKRNYNGENLTHWEIAALITPSIESIPQSLKIQIEPLLITLKEKGTSHNHKMKLAEFTLKLIKNWEELEKNRFF